MPFILGKLEGDSALSAPPPPAAITPSELRPNPLPPLELSKPVFIASMRGVVQEMIVRQLRGRGVEPVVVDVPVLDSTESCLSGRGSSDAGVASESGMSSRTPKQVRLALFPTRPVLPHHSCCAGGEKKQSSRSFPTRLAGTTGARMRRTPALGPPIIRMCMF